MNRIFTFYKTIALLLVLSAISINLAFAHCDTLDGPVVKSARAALESGNVNRVLIWIMPRYEVEVKAAFDKTLAVRKLGSQAQDLADMYFFETVVRLHRAGEGAPYTGLKPAGTNVEPIVALADKAIDANSVDSLRQVLSKVVDDGVKHRFEQVVSKKNFNPDDVEAGRQFVHAYVEFVHYVEGIHLAAEGKGLSHSESQQPSETSHSHSESH